MYQKIVATVLAASAILFLLPTPGAAEAVPEVTAKAAIVVNADNGDVLFEKNADEKRAMASTTKIMTAMLALEQVKIEDRLVTVTDSMVRVEGSSMGLRAGDKLTLRNLATGLLAVSGNDAANTLAIAISGSTEAFSKQMNRRAAELGMTNSHFVTPSGLDDEEHYSTARDMAVLTCAAMKNPDFAAIVGQKSVRVTFANPEKTVRFTNHNKLLSQYEGCTGVKTGFTKKAGRCLVSAAERDGVRLVVVTLCAPDDWNDHKKLLDYGFTRLVSFSVDDSAFACDVPVVGGEADGLALAGEAGVPIVLRRDQAERVERIVELPRFVYAPVREGQTLGVIRYVADGATVAETRLIALEEVAQPEQPKTVWQKIKEFFERLLP